MLELRSLTKRYAKGKKAAVEDLSLSVKDGIITGFLGPNGAGKTTTLKLVTGILKPDEGTVEIDGIAMREQPIDAKRRFGFVPDNPETFAKLKASEYLNFMGDVYGVPSADRAERVDRYASLFKIRDVLGNRIGSFSHGMKQKLAIVGSLIHDPMNWILDEPMVGLDPESAFDLKELMRSRAKEGKAVFFSTHVMEVAEKLCDVIAIIKEGRIIFTGSVAELKEQGGKDRSLEALFLELIDSGARE